MLYWNSPPPSHRCRKKRYDPNSHTAAARHATRSPFRRNIPTKTQPLHTTAKSPFYIVLLNIVISHNRSFLTRIPSLRFLFHWHDPFLRHLGNTSRSSPAPAYPIPLSRALLSGLSSRPFPGIHPSEMISIRFSPLRYK